MQHVTVSEAVGPFATFRRREWMAADGKEGCPMGVRRETTIWEVMAVLAAVIVAICCIIERLDYWKAQFDSQQHDEPNRQVEPATGSSERRE